MEMHQTQDRQGNLEGKIGRLTLLNFMTCFKSYIRECSTKVRTNTSGDRRESRNRPKHVYGHWLFNKTPSNSIGKVF